LGNLAVTVATVDTLFPADATVVAIDSPVSMSVAESSVGSVMSPQAVVSAAAATASIPTSRTADAEASLSLAALATNRNGPTTSTASAKPAVTALDEMYRLLGMSAALPSTSGVSGAGLEATDDLPDVWDLDYMLQEADSQD
jgi:hypothetical protein